MCPSMKLLCEKIIAFPYTDTLVWVMYKRCIYYDRFLYRSFGLNIKCIPFGNTACTNVIMAFPCRCHSLLPLDLPRHVLFRPSFPRVHFVKVFSSVRVILLFPGGLSMFADKCRTSLIPRRSYSNPNSSERQSPWWTRFNGPEYNSSGILLFSSEKKAKDSHIFVLIALVNCVLRYSFLQFYRSIVLR